MTISVVEWGLPMLVTVVCMCALRPLAFATGLVDRPGGRKEHIGDIPLTGGLAIACGVMASLVFGSYAEPDLPYFLACMLIMVATGAIDDRFNLAPISRLVVQVAAVLLMMFGAGLSVSSIGFLLSDGDVILGVLGFPFTVLVTLTAINAFNLFDGSDGVAGGQALIGLVFLGAASVATGALHSVSLIAAMAGCVFGFLCFNWPSKRRRAMRAFMGDAGSTTLGFALAWFSIKLSQGPEAAISPVVALWIFALPVFDLFSSMARRVAAGRSPFSADAEHLHHVLRRAGLSARQIAQLILLSSAMLSACGLAGHLGSVSDQTLFVVWLVLGIAYHVCFGSGLIVKRRCVAGVSVQKEG